MTELYGEQWGLVLFLSFLFTWGIGLTPPLLIRFAFMRRPIGKGWAVGIVTLFWMLNIGLFTALGSQSKSHGALALVAFVSYAILRKAQRSRPHPRKHKKSNQIFSSENNNITSPIEKDYRNEIEITNNDLDNFYESALIEYENNDVVKFIHSKAIVEANGDNSKEKALYIKMRVSNLLEDFKKKSTPPPLQNNKIYPQPQIQNSIQDNNDKPDMNKLNEELLFVSTQPGGLKVHIDGMPMYGTTPININVDHGEHYLQIYCGDTVVHEDFISFIGKASLSYNLENECSKFKQKPLNKYFCIKCLNKFENHVKFCNSCGTPEYVVDN